MTSLRTARRTYRNPVHDGYFADPFALRLEDRYVAYGTGAALGGRVFEVLESTDLATWTSVGGALEPPDPALGADYWAPEVAQADGRFWMYYSVGHGDAGHHLRVAVADDADGTVRRPRGRPDAGRAVRDRPAPVPRRRRHLVPLLRPRRARRPARRHAARRRPAARDDGARADDHGPRAQRRLADLRARPRDVRRPPRLAHPRGPVGARARRAATTASTPAAPGRPRATPSPGRARPARWAPGPSRRTARAGCSARSPTTCAGPGHNSVVTTFGGTDMIVYHAWDESLSARVLRSRTREYRWPSTRSRARCRSPSIRSPSSPGPAVSTSSGRR